MLTLVYIAALIISGIVGMLLFGWIGKRFSGDDAAPHGWDESPLGSSAQWIADAWRDEADVFDDGDVQNEK